MMMKSDSVDPTDVIQFVDRTGPFITQADAVHEIEVQGLLTLATSALADHLADTVDAHDASAVSVLDTANDYTGTTVEAVLAELGVTVAALRPILGEYLAQTATLYLDAQYSVAAEQSVVNQGTGGAALDARYGSTTGADSNDPLLLTHSAGGNYAYLPGAAGNYLSVPDAANLQLTGDLELVVEVAPTDWTPATEYNTLCAKLSGAGGYGLYLGAGVDIGKLHYVWFDTVARRDVSSTVAVTAADGDRLFIKVTHDIDNGTGGNTIKFYTSPDGVTWAQLGADVVTAFTSVRVNDTTVASIGAYDTGGASGFLTGIVHRAIIRDGIGGSTVLDINCALDITDSDATTFTATSGQTVTVNRSASGKKAVLVTRPVWLLGVDDYFEIPDNALLDFGATDSFTVVAATRTWATVGSGRMISKGSFDPYAPCWLLTCDPTSGSLFGVGSTGAGQYVVGPAKSLGSLVVNTGIRNVATDSIVAYLNNTAGTPTTDLTTGTSANTATVQIGAWAGTMYADMELVAVAVFRRALTQAEIANLVAYWEAG